MNGNSIMQQANIAAEKAVAELNVALEGVGTMLKQQQAWLSDENGRLDQMRRSGQ